LSGARVLGQPLLDTILSRSTGKGSHVHGPAHWAGVAAAGLSLLDTTPGADPEVVLLFAMLHDAMRESDGPDPEHGARAAKLARELRDEGAFDLDDGRMEVLSGALVRHDKGHTTLDPMVGACWDSDRLCLPRVWRKPDLRLLSTAAARRLAGTNLPNIFAFGKFVWSAILLEYAAKIGGDAVFLRFGDLPAGGRSAVPLIGAREVGVSVYPGSRRRDGSYVLDFRRLLLGTDTRYLAKLLWDGRPLYVLEGRQVGIGNMGEPCLDGASIVGEVEASEVGVLPDRGRFETLLRAWRAKRRGEDPGPLAFLGPPDPGERPMLPFAWGPTGTSTFGELVEAKTRELALGWGVSPEEYDRIRAEQHARRGERRRTAQETGRERTHSALSRVFGEIAHSTPGLDGAPWQQVPQQAPRPRQPPSNAVPDPNRPQRWQQPQRKEDPWT